MAHEAKEADTIGRQQRAILRAQGQEPDHPGTQLALAQVPALVERDAVPTLVASPCLRGGRGREAARDDRTRHLVRERLAGNDPEAALAGGREPHGAGNGVARANQLPDDRPGHQREVAAQRQQLAQLVLREDGVGLALGLLEAPAELRLGEGGRAGELRHQSREPEARSARNSR